MTKKMMKTTKMKIMSILLPAVLLAGSGAGCSMTSDAERAYSYNGPAIGYTVEKDVTTEVDIEKQSSISIEAQDGVITITPWDGEKLQIIEKRKLKGPAKKESLEKLLDERKYQVDRTSFDITLKKEPEEDLKPPFRRTDDIQLKVPDTIRSFKIKAGSGTIFLSGMDNLSTVNLTLERGNIKIDRSSINKIIAEIDNGNIDIMEVKGSGEFECGRGNIRLKDVTGAVKLKSIEGETIIEDLEGRLDGDVSAGSITVRDSRLKAESRLYASYGNMNVDLEGVESEGRYVLKAAKGNIRLNMPREIGWSLLAKSTYGRIVNKLEQTSDELEEAPSGELYGDVDGGGPTIDVYVDRGNIYLERAKDS